MRKIFTFLSFIVIFSSCKKDTNDIQLPSSEAATILNVSYGTDPLQKMDIYLPANRSTSNTKVFILIHGGGWSGGDKTASNPFVDTLKNRFPDYAIFNINYRLSNGIINLFPTQEDDVHAAVNFVYGKRNEYSVSDKFVLAGESAGGHLAMLQAYKYQALVKIKAVVSFFGPSDLTDMYFNPVNGNITLANALAQVIGATPVQDAAIYSHSSPVTYITAYTGVPTISFHGSADPLVDPSQSENVKDILQSYGINASYTLYPGLGHGTDWTATTFTDAFSKISIFLAANVQ